MPGENRNQIHPVLLPILMMLSQSGRDMEKSLEDLASFIQTTKSALQAVSSGLETFHAGMLKVAAPYGSPGSPAVKNDSAKSTPVADPE